MHGLNFILLSFTPFFQNFKEWSCRGYAAVYNDNCGIYASGLLSYNTPNFLNVD